MYYLQDEPLTGIGWVSLRWFKDGKSKFLGLFRTRDQAVEAAAKLGIEISS